MERGEIRVGLDLEWRHCVMVKLMRRAITLASMLSSEKQFIASLATRLDLPLIII